MVRRDIHAPFLNFWPEAEAARSRNGTPATSDRRRTGGKTQNARSGKGKNQTTHMFANSNTMLINPLNCFGPQLLQFIL